MEKTMNMFDLHTHTIASGHGTRCTITDMAKKAASCGLSLIGITDHGPATLRSGKPSYFRSLHMAPKERCGIRVLYGVELNIMDYKGSLDLDDDTLKLLDFAIASIHPQNLKPGSRSENTAAYICAMKNPYVHMIGHCDDPKYDVDYLALVQAASEHHTLLEVNNSSLSPDGYRGDTRGNYRQLLKFCAEYQHPVVLSSDSHGTSHIGDIRYAEQFIKECAFPDALVLNYDLNRLNCFRRNKKNR